MNKYLSKQRLCLIITTLIIGISQISPAFADSNSASGGTCKIQTQSADNSEWHQLIVDVKNGKFFGNVSSVLNGSASSDYDMLSAMDIKSCRIGEVHTPDAAWLFASALIGFVGLSNKRRV